MVDRRTCHADARRGTAGQCHHGGDIGTKLRQMLGARSGVLRSRRHADFDILIAMCGSGTDGSVLNGAVGYVERYRGFTAIKTQVPMHTAKPSQQQCAAGQQYEQSARCAGARH